jgi:hypothetical protein
MKGCLLFISPVSCGGGKGSFLCAPLSANRAREGGSGVKNYAPKRENIIA